MLKTRLCLTVLFILFVAGVLSNFASTLPDGLERVATDLSFFNTAQSHASLFSDYKIPGISYSSLSAGLAGILGCIMVYVLMYGLAKSLK